MNVSRQNHSLQGDAVLAQYLDDIAMSTPLSGREESTLAERIHVGDDEARNTLVEANLRFVVSISKEYQNRGLSLLELISAGNVGLITAADRFDETRGIQVYLVCSLVDKTGYFTGVNGAVYGSSASKPS